MDLIFVDSKSCLHFSNLKTNSGEDRRMQARLCVTTKKHPIRRYHNKSKWCKFRCLVVRITKIIFLQEKTQTCKNLASSK